MSYAKNTKVSVDKSRADIERVLRRYGCEDFGYRSSSRQAQLAFTMNGKMIRFDLELPDPEEFSTTETGRRRKSRDVIMAAWEQECRSLWRSLLLVIKAKLEAVESGITTFEIEFMPHTVVPGGLFHEVALPQIEKAYETGKLPPLLGK